MRFLVTRLIGLGLLAAAAGCGKPAAAPAPAPDQLVTVAPGPAAPKEPAEPAVWAALAAKDLVPSQMPPAHAARFRRLALEELPKELRPAAEDVVACSFVLTTTDPANPTKDTLVTLLAVEPVTPALLEKLGATGDTRDAVEAMSETRAVLLGKDRVKALGPKVGDRIKLRGLNYPDTMFEFEVAGELPGEKAKDGAVMNLAYLDVLFRKKPDDYAPKARSLNLVFVRLPGKAAFERLAGLVSDSKEFADPAVKLELAPEGLIAPSAPGEKK